MKKTITQLLLLLGFILIVNFSYAQSGLGLPVWPLAVGGGGNAQVVDWKYTPPLTNAILNTAPSEHAGTGAAFDGCGELVFYVLHTGVTNAPDNLFIYDPNGVPLLTNNTPNGPGLNGQRSDSELNVVKVPGSINRYYIIYSRWKTDAGAPINNGGYTPAEVLYAIVEVAGGVLTVIDRDVALTVNGTAHTYTHGKAVSRTAANPNEHYLYLCRRTANNNNISLDRFTISNTGISFDANTGNVPATWWYLTIAGSPIELSPTEDRVAVINRNQSANYHDIFIFNTQLFSNTPNAYQTISLGQLILQPDGIVNLTAQSVIQTAQSNSNLSFLSNMEKKVSDIEFSPNGRFLYFAEGGYAVGSYTNATYLGQIDLGPINQPATYPYDLRLQIQKPPGNFNPSNGAGGHYTGFLDQWQSLCAIQASYDGKLYFTKRSNDTLFVIPAPDQFLPQMLTPGNIDLSGTTHPNIIVNGNVRFVPDQIDGWDYLSFFHPFLNLGNDTSYCSNVPLVLDAGSSFTSYLWQDGSSNSSYAVTQTGTYYVEVVDSNGCKTSDTINVVLGNMTIDVSNDTTICLGDTVVLSASDAASYLWSNGDTTKLITVAPAVNTIYSVTVADNFGCSASDSINVAVLPVLPANITHNGPLCEGETLVLNTDNGESFIWNGPGNFSSILQSPSISNTSSSHSGVYSVTITNNDNCISVGYTDVQIIGKPNAILSSNAPVCEGDNLSLSVSGGSSYTWSGPELFSSIEANTNIQNVSLNNEGVYYVTVTSDLENCSDTSSIYIEIVENNIDIFIPNVFTPNGDGLNDVFLVATQNDFTGFEGLIFNRWGDLIFEWNDIKEGWDGTLNNRPASDGVYFYVISGQNKCQQKFKRHGSVTLLR